MVKPRNRPTKNGGLKYNMDGEDTYSLSRMISGTKMILIVLMIVSVALTAWRWHKHTGLEYKTTHTGLRDDNSAKCRAALGPVRLNDGNDNDNYCIVEHYGGDINYWWMSFSFQLVALVGLIISSLDIMPSRQNVSGDVSTSDIASWEFFSRFFGIGGVVRNLGYYDADYHFWTCRIVTDFYIGFSVVLNIGGLDMIYAIFGGTIMSFYAFSGLIREVAHATHTFEDNSDLWWHQAKARPWAHLPQLFAFLMYYVTVFAAVYLNFVEHNDLRFVVAWSFWLSFAFYVFEQGVVLLWSVYRSRMGFSSESPLYQKRFVVTSLHWIAYFLVFIGIALVPGWAMNDYPEAI